jgi:DNA-binding NtrC family response regulator
MKPNRCLLIVDDEPELRELLQELCSELTTNILIATNGDEAIDILRENKVDAILSDINMPKKTGLQFLMQLRQEGFETPFIVLSGYSDKKNTVEALRLGAVDFIEKPFDDDQILEVIDAALNLGVAINETEKEIEVLFNQFLGPTQPIEKLKQAREKLIKLRKDHHVRLQKKK